MSTCDLCGEPVRPTDERMPARPIVAHRECGLRSVVGGIGHLVAHDWWCTQQGDPDAGLTYRQSARLVDEFVAVVGLDEALNREYEEATRREASAGEA